MDVRIGVVYTAKEIEIEMPDDATSDEVRSTVDAVLDGSSPVLWLTDRSGSQTGVPAERIAYVEIGNPESKGRIGFGAT